MKNIFKTYTNYYLEIIWIIILIIGSTFINKDSNELLNDVFHNEFNLILIAILGFLSIILFRDVILDKSGIINKKIKFLFLSVVIPSLAWMIYSSIISVEILFFEKILALIFILLVGIASVNLKKGFLIEAVYSKILLYIGIYWLIIMLYLIFSMAFSYLFKIHSIFNIIYGIIFITSIVSVLFQEDKRKNFLSEKILSKILIIFSVGSITLIYLNIIINGFAAYYLIVHMIFWLSFLVILINLTIKNRFIPISILPLVVYAIYRVYINIVKYGYTENRYFIFFFSILLIVFCIMQLTNYFKALTYAVIFNLIFIALFFIPHFNAFEVSRRDIMVRFEKMKESDDGYYSNKYYLERRGYMKRKDKILTTDKVIKEFSSFNEVDIQEIDISKYKKVNLVDTHIDDSTDIKIYGENLERFLNGELENDKSKLIPIGVNIEKKSSEKYYAYYYTFLELIKK